MRDRPPALVELGVDLLTVSRFRVFLSLSIPFILAGAFFALALLRWWAPAVLCPILLSFFTYASISHDLVHRNLGLPKWLNEMLLSLTELLALRSGHAYRSSHLHHHAHFPEEDDLEGAAARMNFWQALKDGLSLQFRIYGHAWRKRGKDFAWIVLEGGLCLFLIVLAMISLQWTYVPCVYVVLVVAGSWVYPLMTSWIPHDASGGDPLMQTKLFRGKVLGWLALEHLYHLEHHLYPQVPHHRWSELARRLDPYFQKVGLVPRKLWF